MNAMERLIELSEHLETCGLALVKVTKKYRVHQGWDEAHRIYLPLRGPVWVGPTLKEADTKYSTHTIKMYANAYARGPIESGPRNMVTGKFTKKTVVDLVHPKPKPKLRRKKANVKRRVSPAPSRPVVKKNPDIKHLSAHRSSSDPSLTYDVTLHRTHGIACNCPGYAKNRSCSHVQRALTDAATRMAHERTKVGGSAW